MVDILIGGLSFLLFIAGDFLSLKLARQTMSLHFFIGLAGLAVSSGRILFRSDFERVFSGFFILNLIFALLAALSLVLLVYTLFFALPAKETYIKNQKLSLVDTGAYAVCRHPGVWCLALVYLFAYLFCENIEMLKAGAIFTALNILYVFLQDRYIFPKTIENYEIYKDYTPFLFPTRTSILKGLRDY